MEIDRKINLDLYNYVYAYLDLDFKERCIVDTSNFGRLIFEYRPVYIGKGNCNRITSHEKYSKNKKLSEIIKKGNYRFLKIVENLPTNIAHSLENELIYKIGREDLGKGFLYNKSSGINLKERGNADSFGELNLELNKLLLMLKVLNMTNTIREACLLMKVDERSFYRWLKNFNLQKVGNEWIQISTI